MGTPVLACCLAGGLLPSLLWSVLHLREVPARFQDVTVDVILQIRVPPHAETPPQLLVRVCALWTSAGKGPWGPGQDSCCTTQQLGAKDWLQLPPPPAGDLFLNRTLQVQLSYLKSCKIMHNAIFHMYVYSACKLFYSSISAFSYFSIMYMM